MTKFSNYRRCHRLLGGHFRFVRRFSPEERANLIVLAVASVGRVTPIFEATLQRLQCELKHDIPLIRKLRHDINPATLACSLEAQAEHQITDLVSPSY